MAWNRGYKIMIELWLNLYIRVALGAWLIDSEVYPGIYDDFN